MIGTYIEPGGEMTDQPGWREFYNQGHEGACVGFGWSRCMSIQSSGLRVIVPFTVTRPACTQRRASTREPRPAFDNTRSRVFSGCLLGCTFFTPSQPQPAQHDLHARGRMASKRPAPHCCSPSWAARLLLLSQWGSRLN